MPDLTPETLAELRRRHAALTPFALSFLTGGPGGDPYIALAAEDGSQLTDAGFDAVLLFAEMASDSLPALLDAAAERDALTTVLPCDEKHEPPYDFAYCETHDRTFALGDHCDHAGLSAWSYLDERERQQRGRAVRAEMRAEEAEAERDALAAAWDEGHQAGHEDARAVQSTYPEPTPNPYRAEGDPHA